MLNPMLKILELVVFFLPAAATRVQCSEPRYFISLTLQFLFNKNNMRTYAKTGMPVFSPQSSASSDPSSPCLQDSKSTTNLYQTVGESRKFRETTYFPVTAKNTNRQFLRYTVNLNKSDKQPIGINVTSLEHFKVQRKFTITEHPKPLTSNLQSPTLNVKPSSAQKKPEKKGFNPEKKEETPKQINIPKFLEKKSITEDTPAQNNNKTERTTPQSSTTSTLGPTPQKKTFTPKSNKTSDPKNDSNKITASYSSTDLLKINHVSSPTCESITSRFLEKDHSGNGPCLDDFKKIKYLGEGKFGQVHLVVHSKTSTLYAMKQIKKDSIIKNKMQDQLLIQIKMQFYLCHPNILKLYGIFNDDQNIYLLLQYMQQGTLYSILRKKKTLKQSQASHKLRDVLDGVNYLHVKNIAHRDIKPENIVISNDVCKICDLGWAAICEDRRKTLCGTIDYACPELLEGKEYGIAIDLWCLGVLCYELMVGKCPFYHISRKETMKKIINADLSDINLPSTLPIETKDFILKLLIKNPEERMSAEAALDHPLITKYYDEDLVDIRVAPRRKS